MIYEAACHSVKWLAKIWPWFDSRQLSGRIVKPTTSLSQCRD